ncbi:MAG: hypothetical protein EPO21_22180 [Chloroflexota bacterium]|nr:MAG: hypothetical protein EPO21_22180 [Chloroflexota bacterium]
MGLEFLRDYAARRVAPYAPQPSLLDAPTEDVNEAGDVFLDYEMDANAWTAQPIETPVGWGPRTWPECPRRFIDGKDVGQTIAWLRAPGGFPVPVRLAEIGAVSVRVVDGTCRREFTAVDRVVSMVVEPFPWDEVEDFATALQRHGFRLLSAWPPQGRLSYDFEEMRKAAQNRSNTEMGSLEEAVLARASLEPTIVDGRLEPRAGGFDQQWSPVVGVVKTHSRNYLHARGLQLLYDLEPGERTPLFSLPKAKLPVVSWYLRLSGAQSTMPNWGLVRIELPLHWFEARASSCSPDVEYVAHLCRTLCAYRSLDSSYARAPVSLHPIVRAEQLLGALFTSGSILMQRFYRLTAL